MLSPRPWKLREVASQHYICIPPRIMLAPRDSVPHFQVTAIDGTSVQYSTIWQHRNLVLVVLPPARRQEFSKYVNRLAHEANELASLNTQVVVTDEAVAGVDAPGVLIADRWGEICFAAGAQSAAELPDPVDLVDWARYLEHRCPECEGESR